MMSIVYIFWMYVILFAVIGAMRGWAKELLVIFSVVTSLAVNLLLEKYIPLVRDLDKASTSVFWTRIIILTALVYFGYQTVNVSRFAPKANREKLQDSLFGAVLGGVNGYLIAGTVLYYNHVANYPYPNVLSSAAATNNAQIVEAVERMMAIMPPRFLGEPSIYFVVIVILIFIIVVYI
ncbi:MAG: Colicin V production protein [Chloroflexi bacterium OLB14]|nr:MAG: Colicin V production protein [Chloroflexi bacterium OLB14]